MKKINLLSISLDINIAKEKISNAQERQIEYADYFKTYLIIILTDRKEELKPVKIRNLMIVPTNSFIKLFAIFDAIKIAVKKNKMTTFDLITAQDPIATGIVGIFLKWIFKTPLNIQIHNDYSSTYWKQESLQHRLHSLLLPLTLHFANSVRAVSEAAARVVQQQSKVFIVPVAVDLSYFSPSKKKKEIGIISVGRLVKQKNFPLLIKTLASLIQEFPKLKVVIIGEGPEKKRLLSLIKESNLSGNIELVGAKSRYGVKKLLSKSKIFVLPSNYEGWGLAAVEAAASGLPVVMTDTGGANKIVRNGKTGFIVPLNNAAILEKRLKELLKNPKLRKSLGENGRIWVETSFKRDVLKEKWMNGLILRTKQRSKVCFILPELDPDTPTHYPYTIKLFNEYAEEYPASLLIEKGEPLKESHKFEKVIIQNISIKPLNLIERFILLSKLRLEGFSTFYIHYSYWSLFLLKIISIAVPTKIFYWHAEEFHKKDLEKMKLLERFLLKTAIKAAPTLVTAGENLKKTYAETFDISANKITILPNWIEVKPQKENKKVLQKKLGLPQKKKIILFVHRLSERKGAHLLPQIINRVQKKTTNIHFVIIGSGPLEKTLRSRISNKDATFLGNIPQRKIHDCFSAADVFIMPSLREGSPRVILEAMAAGLPIVAADVGEVRTFLTGEQKKCIIVPGATKAFTKAIVRLLKDKGQRAKLGVLNLKRVNTFSLSSASEALTRVLNNGHG